MASQAIPIRIIEAALDQFGRLGFDAASTRDIARSSGTAMSSITYHFGGKQGLYLACADHIATIVGKMHEPLIERFQTHPPTTPEDARILGLALLENFARMMLSPQSETFSQFIVREQQHPTEAFERLYERMMRPALECSLMLLAIARPSLTQKECRALVMNLVGMALMLRLGRACVSKVMQVRDIDDATGELLIASMQRSASTLFVERSGDHAGHHLILSQLGSD